MEVKIMGAYQYWHRIDKINPERKDKYVGVEVGMCISYPNKKEGRIEIVEFDKRKFKETWSFEVTYVCRTRTDMPVKEKVDYVDKKLSEVTEGDSSQE
jgi:hypothetical protein